MYASDLSPPPPLAAERSGQSVRRGGRKRGEEEEEEDALICHRDGENSGTVNSHSYVVVVRLLEAFPLPDQKLTVQGSQESRFLCSI